MVTVVGDGGDGHRLERADGTLVGIVRNGAVRIGEFRSDAALTGAALELWTALDGALRRQYPGWRSYAPVPGTLRLVHDGAWEWVSDGVRPLARVIRPPARATDGATRLEFVLPTYATDGVLVAAAVTLVRALDRLVPEGQGAPPATMTEPALGASLP